MLFNSYIFLFCFLPVTLVVFYRVGNLGYRRVAIAWLVAASLFYYAWWKPEYLSLILASILFNYALGVTLSHHQERLSKVQRKLILLFGVSANLALLGYFKYATFFLHNLSRLLPMDLTLQKVVLPLAISFFTFQQITYLVDAYRGETREYQFLHYCLFVTFFPQLIAGPIVHHKEMMPQFARSATYRFNPRHLAVGLSIFAIGLFKKVIIADGVAHYASPAFRAVADGGVLTFFEAWGAALGYTFQLYFDFSGYSDMAIGLARMFGIRLPLNFHSPYKSVNIIEFWRRWHMTLSRFLRDYIYIPLGGNRRGSVRRYGNLMMTMLIGGLWHGAGWTFIIWGGLHGIYLVINYGWRIFRQKLGQDVSHSSLWGQWTGRAVTFMFVVFGWVFFRAESFGGAISILKSMAGQHGVALPLGMLPDLNWLGGLGVKLQAAGWHFGEVAYFAGFGEIVALIFLLGVVWFAPNTQEIMARYRPTFDLFRGDSYAPRWRWWQWQPTLNWACFTSLLTVFAVGGMSSASEFLYFQF